MRDGDDGAGEALQIVFQNGKRRNVQIVRRLVKQQHVGCRHEDGQQIESPPFAAGQTTDGGLLQIRREQEAFQHGLGGECALVRFYLCSDAINEVVYALVQIQLPALLRKMTDLDRLAQLDRAAVRRKLAREHAQERRFARAVSAHDADAVAAQKAVGKITEDRPPVIALGDVLQCDDLFAETARSRRELHCAVALRGLLVLQLLIALNALLALRAPGLTAAQDPFALDTQDGLPLALGRLRHLRALPPQLKITRVIGLVVVELPA